MVIEPKIRGFICTTAHPVGCAENVKKQIEYVKKHPVQGQGPKKVLVVGASTGYGLASRIVSAFAYGADTLGVFFERESQRGKPASTGWYLTAALEAQAKSAGLYCKSINGDAFSHDIRNKAIQTIKKDLGKIDLLIYSLASPRRTDPDSGEVYGSVLKTIGKPYTTKTVDTNSREVSEVTIEPGTQEEINGTVKVMGGEDWELWIKALQEAGVLAEGFRTVAYSYIGPEVTMPIYRNGTIGKAKEHLEDTVSRLDKMLAGLKGKSYVSVNKALVTQASSAIPVVPLYIGILYKIMKEKGLHEGTIEQIQRLFNERLYTSDGKVPVDADGRIRIDDWELQDEIQQEVAAVWQKINSSNINDLADFDAYQEEFKNLFGFEFPGVDYSQDVEIEIPIRGLVE